MGHLHYLMGNEQIQKLTRLVRTILTVAVIIVHLIEWDSGCAVQTRERLRFIIEVMVW